MTLKVTILGCGHSGGTPMIGNKWFNCDPQNPKNRRLRPSVMVHFQGKNVLIDTSPDLRQQFLENNIHNIDAILYTHDHGDHCHGLNDVGIISRAKNETIPVYCTEKTFKTLNQAFGYAFHNDIDHYAPFLMHKAIQENKTFSLFGLDVLPIPQDHGFGPSLTFRLGDFAYSTDVKQFDPDDFEKLKGIHTWVVDCLKEEEHKTHSHLSQTLEWIAEIKPQKAYLTHMHPLLDYEQLKSKLPPGVEPAYDGLVFHV